VQLAGYSAFRGVRLSASYDFPRGTVRPPRFGPAPGNYARRACVHLSRPRGTVVRYTTDGTDPDASSPIYTSRLTLTASTQIRARSFGSNGTGSIVIAGDYSVVPEGTVEPLTLGQPVHHLAGMGGTEHLFKLTVPAGTHRLLVQMDGGPGNAQLFAKFGAPPTKDDYERRETQPGNYGLLEVGNATPGDWYLLIASRRAYSGVSLFATVQPEGVDLIAWEPALEPRLTIEVFREDDPSTPGVDERPCEVQEGMITTGTHRLLRFSTQTRNIGSQDLALGDPEGNPAFQFFACHGHYHFLGFASYQLLDSLGQSVASGRKVSFCLLDGLRWDPRAAPFGHFHCDLQGIQSGWADVYDAGLPGQWIDVTDVPPGTYTLVITMNPDRLIEESDYSNNSASTQIVIDPSTLIGP
jgi:hypothetical protein